MSDHPVTCLDCGAVWHSPHAGGSPHDGEECLRCGGTLVPASQSGADPDDEAGDE